MRRWGRGMGTGSGAALLFVLALIAPAQSSPIVPAGHVALAVTARYGREAPQINAGLYWRVYADKPDSSGLFRLVKEDRTPIPTFVLPPGGYVVHVTFGLAKPV